MNGCSLAALKPCLAEKLASVFTCTLYNIPHSVKYSGTLLTVLGSTAAITSAMRPNAFTFAIRQFVGGPRLWPVSLTLSRAASTKHPKGFISPSAEELAELRERVQEFTSKFHVLNLGLHFL
jgi:hypothetical protein